MSLRKLEKLIVLFLVFPFILISQNFPVQVNPQVVPPYSLKLSEYGTGMSEKIILNLLLTDVSEFNLQVRLKLYIENNAGITVQSSDNVIGTQPISLDGGIPLRLTNVDLKPYFSLQNLRGINPIQYNKPFPEGLYRFCFEVYEAFSDRLISRKSCAVAYLVLNDPPFLNLPNRGEQLTVKDPQNIIFQWTPRHLNATNVEYEFTLAEIWDRQMNPQAAFLGSRPLYQTQTFANTLLYGPAEPALLPNKQYAWRVRAMVSDGISETSVFKNDGYSEIYHFTYADTCKEPQYVLAEAKSPVSEKILWQGNRHTRYNVQYRNKEAENNVWFDTGTVNEFASIYNLEPGTSYEFRVGGQCLENGPFTYSQIYEFTTSVSGDDTANYNCGITPEIVVTNKKPLEALVVNDVFTAGDFPVTVKFVGSGNTDATRIGQPVIVSDGYYSGWGFITVPYLENTKIKVSFNRIGINSDYQLIEGVVLTDYDENWGGVDDISNEIEALLTLDNAIVEALNLDINKVTKENTKAIATAIVDGVQKEQLSEDLQKEITNAANNFEKAGSAVIEAKTNIENANTKEEKKEAENELKEATKNFEEAQSTISDANEKVEKEKKAIADLLKKAIYELYREGRDQETDMLSYLNSELINFNRVELFNNETLVEQVDADFEIVIEDTSSEQSITNAKEYYNTDKKFAIYLFAKMLSEENLDKKVFEGFVIEAKKYSEKLIKIVSESEDKKESEVIDNLKIELRKVFMQILITNNYE